MKIDDKEIFSFFFLITILVLIFPETSITNEPLNNCDTSCKALIHSSLDSRTLNKWI
jgi:hypothetical protein